MSTTLTNSQHTMVGRQLSSDAKAAEGIQGRILVVDEKNAKALDVEGLQKKEAEFRAAAKAGSDIPRWMGARLGEAKKEIPDLKDAGGRQIARAYADDYHHFSEVVKARREGRYLEFRNEDGSRERGIVSGSAGEQAREGLWVMKDGDGRVRQIATFQNGKPNGSIRNYREDGSMESSAYFKDGVQQGTAYQYNAESKPIHKEVWENGQRKSEESVDPTKVAEEKNNRAAQFRAMNSMRVGR